MIPADHWHDNGDGTAWLVVEVPGGSAPAAWEQDDEPCFLCEGSSRIQRGEDDHRPIKCPDCDGTGRHTFQVTVLCEHCRDTRANPVKWANHDQTYRVHALEVIPIYALDHEHYEAAWIEIRDDGAHRFVWDGIRNAHTSEPITLPSGATSGMWAVLLAVQGLACGPSK